MLGGSAIRMAETLKNNNKSTEIICIDPFTGDVNMWDWEKNGGTGNGGWRFLHLFSFKTHILYWFKLRL